MIIDFINLYYIIIELIFKNKNLSGEIIMSKKIKKLFWLILADSTLPL